MRHFNKNSIAPVFLSFESIGFSSINKKVKNPVSWYKKSILGVSTKIRNDFSDMDYIEKLDETSLSFLKAFNREYYNADFKHKHKKLHTSKKLKKSVYDLNNQKNRDIYALLKCRGRLLPSGCFPELTKESIIKRMQKNEN